MFMEGGMRLAGSRISILWVLLVQSMYVFTSMRSDLKVRILKVFISGSEMSRNRAFINPLLQVKYVRFQY